MRIRSTKPEFWRSRRIASVDWEARLVLKGLESYVDDNGVGKDDLELIVADLFSRDLAREPSRTLARVSEAISHLHQAGLVWRYEADGTDLLYLSFWESIQRVDKPQSGRFPRPDGTLHYKDSEIREPSRDFASPREASRLEQGNRGTGEQSSSSEIADAIPRPDVDEILDYFDAALRANDPECKPPTRSKKNRDAARLLLDRDGRTVVQVKACIDFATRDEFWRSNILSISKLRDKYDQLRAKAQRTNVLPMPNRQQDEGADWMRGGA